MYLYVKTEDPKIIFIPPLDNPFYFLEQLILNIGDAHIIQELGKSREELEVEIYLGNPEFIIYPDSQPVYKISESVWSHGQVFLLLLQAARFALANFSDKEENDAS